jgi:hypothetical protein
LRIRRSIPAPKPDLRQPKDVIDNSVNAYEDLPISILEQTKGLQRLHRGKKQTYLIEVRFGWGEMDLISDVGTPILGEPIAEVRRTDCKRESQISLDWSKKLNVSMQ